MTAGVAEAGEVTVAAVASTSEAVAGTAGDAVTMTSTMEDGMVAMIVVEEVGGETGRESNNPAVQT